MYVELQSISRVHITHTMCHRLEEGNCKFKIEFQGKHMDTGMNKLYRFASRFNCTLDCIEFRDIPSFLCPVEFAQTLEKITRSHFSDEEVCCHVVIFFLC